MDNKELKDELGGIKGLINKIYKALKFKNAYTETLNYNEFSQFTNSVENSVAISEL